MANISSINGNPIVLDLSKMDGFASYSKYMTSVLSSPYNGPFLGGYESGGISVETGEETTLTTYVRTKRYFPINKGIEVHSSSASYYFGTRYYDSDGNYVSGVNNITNSTYGVSAHAPEGATMFRIIARRSDAGNMSDSDVELIESSITMSNIGPYEYTDSVSSAMFECVSVPVWSQGNIGASSSNIGKYVASTSRIYSPTYYDIDDIRGLSLFLPSPLSFRLVFYTEANEDSGIYTSGQAAWTDGNGICQWPETPPVNARYVRIVVKHQNEAGISPSSGYGVMFASNEFVIEVESRLSALEKSSVKGKRISILGDSLSTFGGSSSDEPRYADGTYTYAGNRCRYPQSNLLLDVDETYWMQIINHFGLVLGINESWAGSRVSNTSATDTGDVGPNRHIASMTRIGHLGENGAPDIILVNAGTNDIQQHVEIGTFNTESPKGYTEEQIAALDVSTFANAYRAMLIRLLYYYRTSKIIVLMPNYVNSTYTPTDADNYCEVIKEACDYFGVNWFDMRTTGISIYNLTTYAPDGVHYNTSGSAVVANNIIKFMEGIAATL